MQLTAFVHCGIGVKKLNFMPFAIQFHNCTVYYTELGD